MLPIRQNQNWIPAIFGDLFDNDWMNRNESSVPAINISENENQYKIEVAAPGMTKEDFKIHVDSNDRLIISMEKKNEKTEDKGEDGKKSRYLRREFSYARFRQAMVLPDNIDKENISARIEHGILEVELPKLNRKNENNIRQIEIR